MPESYADFCWGTAHAQDRILLMNGQTITGKVTSTVDDPNITITATVLASGSYANTATTTSSTYDPVPGNNSATNTPVRLTAAETVLRGASLNDAALACCGEAAVSGAELAADAHGTSAYKRELLRVHVQRALRQAVKT